MATEVRLPREGSTTMASGVVSEWLVAVGDDVDEGQVLAEVDTDKVAFELVAPTAGTVLVLAVPVGDEVEVGGLVAVIGDPDEVYESSTGPEPQLPTAAPSVGSAPRPGDVDRGPEPDAAGAPLSPVRVPASPAARRRARELELEIQSVPGTGPGGRVTVEDVEGVAATPRPASEDPEGALTGLSGHRRIVAERMSQASSETAAVTLHTSVEVTHLLDASPFLAGSLADIVAYAAVAAVAAEPSVNSTLTRDGIAVHPTVGLGYAVEGARGLVVPVVRAADRLDLAGFAAARRRLVRAAIEGGLTPQDLDGGTLTVTNLGPFGVEWFTPIITPGQCVVLGVGATRPALRLQQGRVVEEQVLSLSLTFDHRIIDGAQGARFLQAITQQLAGGICSE